MRGARLTVGEWPEGASPPGGDKDTSVTSEVFDERMRETLEGIAGQWRNRPPVAGRLMGVEVDKGGLDRGGGGSTNSSRTSVISRVLYKEMEKHK